MIVLKHTDGRVVVLAHDRGLGARVKGTDGSWCKADMSVEELSDFTLVRDELTQEFYFNLARLLTPLSEEERAEVSVPTREQFLEALRKGAQELREYPRFKPKGRW